MAADLIAGGRLLQQLAGMLQQVQTGGELAPFAERQQWDRLVSSTPPELRELLTELARFADLWRYFREQKLGPEIVGHLGRVHRLSVAERVVRLKEINRRLMERVCDAGKGTQFRH